MKIEKETKSKCSVPTYHMLVNEDDWPRPLVLWLIGILAAIVWQPFLLGFYADDWPLILEAVHHGPAFSFERLVFAYNINPARPAMTPFWFVFSSLLGDQALLWHLALLLVNGVTVFIAARIICIISGARSGFDRHTSLGCAAAWLILPTNATFHFWPTSVPVIATLDMFGLLALAVLSASQKHHRKSALWYIALGIFYGLICISYEAFFFQWIPLVLLTALVPRVHKRSVQEVVQVCFALMGGQGLATGWYFLAKHVTRMEKPIIPDWLTVSAQNFRRLIPEVARSTDETRVVVLISGIGLLVLTLAGVARRLYLARKSMTDTMATLLILGSLSIGAAGSVIAFSLGGRPIVGTGVEARTFLVLDFWAVVGLGVLVMQLRRWVGGGYYRVYIGLLAVGLSGFTVSHVQRAFDWVSAWKMQQRILSEAPIARLASTASKDQVVFIGPRDLNGGPVFLQSYELETALSLTYPVLRGRSFLIFNVWLGELVWDGRKLEYPAFPKELMAPSSGKIYVWIPERREFWSPHTPFRVRQNLTVVRDPDPGAEAIGETY